MGWRLFEPYRLRQAQVSVQSVQKLAVGRLSAAASVQVVFQKRQAALVLQFVQVLALVWACWAEFGFFLPLGAAGPAADKACLELRLECRLN